VRIAKVNNLQFGTVEDVIGHLFIVARRENEKEIIGYLKLGAARPFQDDARIVEMVEVESEYRRQGIASALWRFAKDNGYKPVHEIEKTEDGVAWSEAVGD
jgi:ribosomal protein S18 acetylase RimI-like enzyme